MPSKSPCLALRPPDYLRFYPRRFSVLAEVLLPRMKTCTETVSDKRVASVGQAISAVSVCCEGKEIVRNEATPVSIYLVVKWRSKPLCCMRICASLLLGMAYREFRY